MVKEAFLFNLSLNSHSEQRMEKRMEEGTLLQMVKGSKTRPFTSLLCRFLVQGGVGFFYRHTLGEKLTAHATHPSLPMLYICPCLQMSA
uniref:Uncharacterized protein n=1 Tax=Cucumis melo TaxID=3656 RepID=A0A9I9ED24_CUCME